MAAAITMRGPGRRPNNTPVRRLIARPRKLLQERGETFRDRLVGGTLLGPQPLPEFPQPWPSGQDLTRFGLARPTLLALAPKDSSGGLSTRCATTLPRDAKVITRLRIASERTYSSSLLLAAELSKRVERRRWWYAHAPALVPCRPTDRYAMRASPGQ